MIRYGTKLYEDVKMKMPNSKKEKAKKKQKLVIYTYLGQGAKTNLQSCSPS